MKSHHAVDERADDEHIKGHQDGGRRFRYSQGNLRKRLRHREDVEEKYRGAILPPKTKKGKGGEREMVSDSWQGCDDVENQRETKLNRI